MSILEDSDLLNDLKFITRKSPRLFNKNYDYDYSGSVHIDLVGIMYLQDLYKNFYFIPLYLEIKYNTEVFILPEIYESINNFLHKNKIIIVPTVVEDSYYEENTAHANLIIINPKKKTIEIYDPNGDNGYTNELKQNVITAVNLIQKRFRLQYSMSCADHKINTKSVYGIYNEGYCMVCNVMYIEYTICNNNYFDCVNLFNFFKRFYPSNKYTKIIIDPADVTDTTTTEKTIDTEEHALITRAYIEYLYEYLRRLVLQNKNKYEGNINTFIKNTVINHYVSMTRCDS
jgi:hypothetical protein